MTYPALDELARDLQTRRVKMHAAAEASYSEPEPSQYRELQASDCYPDFDTYDRICKLFGWPETYAGRATGTR
jgi:hypothetical protein